MSVRVEHRFLDKQRLVFLFGNEQTLNPASLRETLLNVVEFDGERRCSEEAHIGNAQ